MKPGCRLELTIAAAGLIFSTASPAIARPHYSRDCFNCHFGTPPNPLAPEAVGWDAMADPDESLTGAPDRGALKVYTAAPGASVDLQILVDFLANQTDPTRFAVALKRMEVAGVENNGRLTYSADPDWFYQEGQFPPDPAAPYYSLPQDQGMTYAGPQTLTFTFAVDPLADEDYYDLVFALAGTENGVRFYGDERFYLHVVPEPSTAALLGALSMAVVAGRRRRPAG